MKTNKPRHGLPTDVDAVEAVEDAQIVLLPVIEGFGPYKKTLYLGNLTAAEDAGALKAANITESFNVSINIFPQDLALDDGTEIRRYQIGMIDGPGNSPYLLAGAVMTLQGLLHGYIKGKPHYPPHRCGNILVHCRGGRSRSVTVLALWMAAFCPERFASYEAALEHIRQLRDLPQTYPLPDMMALADHVISEKLLPGLLS
ncbi:protein phosphatase [uncultured Cohaesibacter sp.]|uniref:protein phosphatase n=1 Tax=uncultured Cohaesibacter sp. TaxID=1002546 RepID=UPI0029C67E08|nr:protein phosphatase [uncultured Cohaesibacter sp.]